jgi:antitoxin ParD1/3/4
MAGRNFGLTPRLSLFVDRQVGSGRQQNASEVGREALRRYEASLVEENSRVAAIRAAIREGREDIARGDDTLVATADDAAQLYAVLTGRRSATGREIAGSSRG